MNQPIQTNGMNRNGSIFLLWHWNFVPRSFSRLWSHLSKVISCQLCEVEAKTEWVVLSTAGQRLCLDALLWCSKLWYVVVICHRQKWVPWRCRQWSDCKGLWKSWGEDNVCKPRVKTLATFTWFVSISPPLNVRCTHCVESNGESVNIELFYIFRPLLFLA